MPLQNLHNKLFRFFEKIVSKSWILTKLYVSFFEEMTIKEFSAVPLGEGAKVLVIGCGSIPNTVITIAKSFPWNVVGIDRDPRAVEKARRIVERYKLENVKIMEADGKDFDVKGYDLIVVALGVEPKNDVIKRISKEVKEGCYIVCRTSEPLSKLYGKEGLGFDGLNLCSRYRRADFLESILLVKGGKAR